MDLERFDYFPNNDMSQPPVSVGVHIRKRAGLETVHLFLTSDNEGDNAQDHLWGIAGAIGKDILMGRKPDECNWTVTGSHVTSALNFTTLPESSPLKIDMSNEWPFVGERHRTKGEGSTIEECAQKAEDWLREFEHPDPFKRTPPGEPKSVFTIPCDHPKAAGGMFYAAPEFFGYDDGDHETVILNAPTAIQAVHFDMREHSRYKLSSKGWGQHTPEDLKSQADQWIESTSIEYPRNTGTWGIDVHGNFTLFSGQASIIELANQLKLPFLPVSVANDSSVVPNQVETVRNHFGYLNGFARSSQMDLNPKFK